MAITQININQNQLNTQNGSYVELIKNTQDSKVGLTAALINKGANVSSESTFTDLVNATNNLITANSDFIVGDIIDGNSFSIHEGDFRYFYAKNEKGDFLFSAPWVNNNTTATTTTTIYIYNVTPEAMATGIVQRANVTVNSFYENNYGAKPPYWVSKDGKVVVIFGADGQNIYKYLINYDNLTSSVFTDIQATLVETYTLSSAINARGCIWAYDENRHIIGIKNNWAMTTLGTYQYVDFSNSTTNLEPTSLTLSRIERVSYNNNPTYLSTDYLIFPYTTSFQIAKVDYENNTITKLTDIPYANIYANSINVTEIEINNRQCFVWTHTYQPETGYSKIAFVQTLYMFFPDNQEIKTFVSDDVLSLSRITSFVSNINSVLSPVSYSINNNTLYLCSWFKGIYWKITVENNEIIAKSNKILGEYNELNDSKRTINYSAPATMDYENKTMYYLKTTGAIVSANFKNNQLIAIKYNEDYFTPSLTLSEAMSGELDYPEPEILVEDN